MIAEFDWSSSLGPISGWPQSLQTATAILLRSPVPIVMLWGEDGIMIYNDAYSGFAGLRHPELLGSKVREGWPEVADFNNHIMKVVHGQGKTLAYRDQNLVLYRHGRAESVYLNLDYSPVLDESGKPAGVIAIVVETTAKVEAEQRLMAEREGLRRMFEQAPGFIAMMTGPEHRFGMVNTAYSQLIGHRDVVGKPIVEALPEIGGQGFIELLDRVYQTGEPYSGRGVGVLLEQSRGAVPEERFLDFVYQPIVSEEGTISGIFVQGHDVTEQKRNENALRESEERFRLVAENAPVMLWMSDIDGKCLYLNRAQRAFWGVTPEAISDFQWGSTIHTEDQPMLYGQLADALQSYKGFTTESRLLRTDGVYRIIQTTAQPRFGGKGEFLGMIGVNVDVTETRKAEEALVALNTTLEQRVAEEVAERSRAEETLRQAQKMDSIGKLTGGVAHDFNNLLQVVSGNLQLLQKDLAGNERAERRVANALAGVGRGAKLASQLLAFGRRQALEPKVVNIGRLISGVEEMLRRTIGEAIEIETVVSGGLWNTFIDPGQLENALLNLAINARDAMDEAGKLTIEAGNAFLDDGYADRHEDLTAGQYVVLAVTDTGAGMSPEVAAQAFEPFFSTKPQGKGTGLGLSMVYGFVKQSGGHVKIYSEVGEGTTVKIYLPRAHQTEDIKANPLAGNIVGGTETILVAEDEEEVRNTVVEMLGDLGYRVLTAKDALSALSVIESGVPVDLLFTDVVMPGPMKSTELARKAHERLPNIAVLFTSGYTENAIVHGGRLDPGVELLSKPYSRESLARKVRHVLGNAAQRMAAMEASPLATAVENDGASSASGRNVLLCEDDALIRMTTAGMLEDFGFHVIETGSAAEAIAAAGRGAIDLVITDIGLPDMQGMDLVRRLRDLLPKVPVILATGARDVPGFEALSNAAILTKPYDETALTGLAERLLPGAAKP